MSPMLARVTLFSTTAGIVVTSLIARISSRAIGIAGHLTGRDLHMGIEELDVAHWLCHAPVGVGAVLHVDVGEDPDVTHVHPSPIECVVKAKSNTMPACPIQILPPLIFVYFSGPIQTVPRPSQVFRILL
ncbi:MAG: hypothetical protein AAF637_04150 [Pseudomonadota bacterium]